MRWSVIAALVLACAQSAAAQTSTQTPPAGSPAAGAANQTITMTGCVAPGASPTDPFTLANATIGAATPGVPPAPGATGTTGAAGATGATGTTGATGAGTGAGGGAAAGAGTAAGAGAATGATPPPVGTTGATSRPPTSSAMPNAASAATATSYRLSGTEMEPFAGQRVEISGTLVPASATAPAGSSAAETMREFRVVSVRPLGNCPQ